jgi:hypothetical protein
MQKHHEGVTARPTGRSMQDICSAFCMTGSIVPTPTLPVKGFFGFPATTSLISLFACLLKQARRYLRYPPAGHLAILGRNADHHVHKIGISYSSIKSRN